MPLRVLALSLVLAACAPPTRWERVGGDPAALTDDHNDCRRAAEQEASRRFPYGDGPPVFGPIRPMGWLEWTQMIDRVRWDAATDLTAACMREKGYVRVTSVR